MTLSKTITRTSVHRGLCRVLAGGALCAAASATIVLPAATAAPDMTCSASGVQSTVSSVSEQVGSYLTNHPETDMALTDIAKQPPTQASASYKTYFASNPTVADDLRTIQQPVTSLKDQCGLQVPASQTMSALNEI